MDDLVAWLGQQIGEDDRVAPMVHVVGCAFLLPCPDGCCGEGACDCGVPARVLAEVAAKRAVLDELAYWRSKLEAPKPRIPRAVLDHELACRYEVAASMVRLLALPFAGRPGWRPEWATEVTA
jgi:hypothetical protein